MSRLAMNPQYPVWVRYDVALTAQSATLQSGLGSNALMIYLFWSNLDFSDKIKISGPVTIFIRLNTAAQMM